jgi:hypothetical protein
VGGNINGRSFFIRKYAATRVGASWGRFSRLTWSCPEFSSALNPELPVEHGVLDLLDATGGYLLSALKKSLMRMAQKNTTLFWQSAVPLEAVLTQSVESEPEIC